MRAWLKRDAPFLLLLTAACLTLFWPALRNPSLLLHPTFLDTSDILVIHWPKAALIHHTWQTHGELPYWTPLILSGMPLAANQLAMISYPPAWLFALLPIEPLFNGLFIFHCLLGGYGGYFLLRSGFRLSPGAALLGGLIVALGGKWWAHAAGGHVSMVGAVAWMPWAVLAMHRLLHHLDTGAGLAAPARWGWLALVAVAIAMQIVTHTLPVIYSVYLLAALLLFHVLVAAPQGNRLRRLFIGGLHLALVLLLAALLGAAQLLPLLELVEFSNRSLTLAQAAEFAPTPLQLLLGLLLPDTRSGHELIIYMGLIPLLLAPFGLSRRRHWSWFYGGLLLFSLLFALGDLTPLHPLFYYLAPGFRWVRTPARLIFVGTLALAVLAGFAVERFNQQRWTAGTQRWLSRGSVALIALALLLGLGLALGLGQLVRSSLALALLLPPGVALLLLRSRRVISATVTVILLTLLTFVDLAWFNSSMIRYISPTAAFAPGQAAAAHLAQQPGLFRVYSPSYSLPMQTAGLYGLHLADGVEPVHLAIYDDYMARAGGYHTSGFSVTIPHFDGPLDEGLRDVEPDLRLLGLLNVEYLAAAFPMAWEGLTLEATPGDSYIYRNAYAQPRAWVVHQTEPLAQDWLAQLAALPHPGQTALIERGQPVLAGNHPPTSATITAYSANHITLKTTLTEPGWLLLSEIWYPGWQARINGDTQPVARVNGLLRGVYLAQPGAYNVELNYRPATVIWGGWLAAATGLLLAVGLATIWLRARAGR